jgi:histidinol-phosphate aminotransferase
LGVLADEEYTKKNCATVIENRAWTTTELQARGFEVLPSKTNFVFAKHEDVSGETVYAELKARGVLVRHFKSERIRDYARITIGSREQMEALMRALDEILAQAKL